MRRYSRSTVWCFVLLCMVLAACAVDAKAPNTGKKKPKKKNTFPPRLSTVKVMSDDQFVCDGTLRYLAIPKAPYPNNDNKDSPYNLPDGITCSRPQGGNPSDLQGDKCGGLASIDCLPFAGIGPINSAPVGTPDNLALPPGNGLEFSLASGSNIIFKFINWTVWDVGTGGAKFEVLFNGGSNQVLTHEWTTNGQQPDGSCGACTNCEVGKGIKSFAVTAGDGQSISGWILSQKYTDARCGNSCFDLDASYWTGVEYICAGPTCADTNPNDATATPFVCSPNFNYEPNPAAADKPPSQETCCLPKTCNAPNPATAPGVPLNCSQFDTPSTPTTTGQTCTLKPDMGPMLVGPSPVTTCCECVSTPADTPDLKVNKVVSPGKKVVKKKKKKTTKKKKKTKKTTSATAKAVEGVDFTVKPPAAGRKTSIIKSGMSIPQPVGETFTFDIEVSNQGLGPATSVDLKDTVPSGLRVTSVTPSECFATGNRITCNWDEIAAGNSVTLTVTATGILAGSWENCATATSQDTDANPDDNTDCATAVVEAACCTKVGTQYTCEDTTAASCPRISGSQQFYADKACMDEPCEKPAGACCLTVLGRCIEGLDQSTCIQNSGDYYASQTCAQITVAGLCEAPSEDGACCLKDRGLCYDKQQELICATAGGDFYKGKTCLQVQAVCFDTSTGACCNSKTGTCSENVPQKNCPSSSNTWLKGGRCSADGFCTGACCAEDGTCAQTLKADCAEDPTWRLYSTCDQKQCGDQCADEWQTCDPNNPDACCDGLTCEYTYPGCAAGTYVCKSGQDCVGLNQPCGGSSGYSCCDGLMCQWNHLHHGGSCVPVSGCIGPGGGCGSDYDTCSGCRCFGGISKRVTWGMCNKACSHYGCYAQRQMNCGVYYASAASSK